MGWDMGGKHKGGPKTLCSDGEILKYIYPKMYYTGRDTMLLKPAPSCVHGACGSRVGPVWEEVITGQGQPMGHSHHTTATAGEPEHRVVLPTPVTTCIRYTFPWLYCLCSDTRYGYDNQHPPVPRRHARRRSVPLVRNEAGSQPQFDVADAGC